MMILKDNLKVKNITWELLEGVPEDDLVQQAVCLNQAFLVFTIIGINQIQVWYEDEIWV